MADVREADFDIGRVSEPFGGSIGRGSSGRRAWATVIIIAALSTCSYLDRQVLALLVPNLERSFGLSEVQIGFLMGPAFIVVYNVVLILASVVVDRWNRKLLIVTGAAIWALMTFLSGFAQNFEQLIVLRAGLAFGEALLGPAAISLIGDLFDRESRALPNATYLAGSIIGSAGSTIIGAMMLQVATLLGGFASLNSDTAAWRVTLVGCALPTFALALALLLIGTEPGRGLSDAGRISNREPLTGHLRTHGLLYAGVCLGFGFFSMVSMSVSIWAPTHLLRTFDLSQVRVGYLLGALTLLLGLPGAFVMPIIFRHLIRSGRPETMLVLAAASIVCAAVAALIGGFASSLVVCVICFGATMFFTLGVSSLSTLIIQLYAPSHVRGRITAGLFFTVYMLSAGVAPVVVPLIARDLFGGSGAIGQAIGLVAAVAGAISATLLFVTRIALRSAERALSLQKSDPTRDESNLSNVAGPSLRVA
jgi:MFS family permease